MGSILYRYGIVLAAGAAIGAIAGVISRNNIDKLIEEHNRSTNALSSK